MPLAPFPSHSRCHCRLRSPPLHRYVYTGDARGACAIYDTLTGEVVDTIDCHRGIVRDVSWHPHRPHLVTSSVRWRRRGRGAEATTCPPSAGTGAAAAAVVHLSLFLPLFHRTRSGTALWSGTCSKATVPWTTASARPWSSTRRCPGRSRSLSVPPCPRPRVAIQSLVNVETVYRRP